MTSTRTARRRFTTAALVAGFTLAILILSARADAACMDNLLHQAATLKSGVLTGASPTAGAPAASEGPRNLAAAVVRVADATDDEPIVGLWEFRIEGTPPDFGTQAWHSDGTELMFSAGRNPAQGDVCQGVWRRIGPRTYSLNHIAMGWDPGFFGVRVHIHAVVKVDRSGDTYTGTYTANAYFVAPAAPFDESAPLGGGSGTITGTRVKPD
jgi:hypothetical protein